MAAEPDEGELLEEETGYLISVSDLMSGLLMVFIITLMAFVFNFQQAELEAQAKQMQLEEETQELQDVVTSLTNTNEIRARMLREIQRELDARGIQVKVDEEHGVLHLRENAIRFRSGRASLLHGEQEKVRTVGEVLAAVLPCYAANPEAVPGADGSCGKGTAGKLESVFIEGHTDNVPIGSSPFESNWDLSAQRAITAYGIVEQSSPELMKLENQQGYPLFSVTGYGDKRPVREHEVITPDPYNRRIDLRFIMTSPRADSPEVTRKLRDKGLR